MKEEFRVEILRRLGIEEETTPEADRKVSASNVISIPPEAGRNLKFYTVIKFSAFL